LGSNNCLVGHEFQKPNPDKPEPNLETTNLLKNSISHGPTQTHTDFSPGRLTPGENLACPKGRLGSD
jgi:hypothetical protein